MLWEHRREKSAGHMIQGGTKSFNESQVSSGGVSLEEINLKTMESKLVKNLYITGELLDITGECGGYNLGIAWKETACKAGDPGSNPGPGKSLGEGNGNPLQYSCLEIGRAHV